MLRPASCLALVAACAFIMFCLELLTQEDGRNPKTPATMLTPLITTLAQKAGHPACPYHSSCHASLCRNGCCPCS